jgi:hypothetical protein
LLDINRGPERKILKLLSAGSIETEEREGMKKTEEMEEKKEVLPHDFVKLFQNDLVLFLSSETLVITTALLHPHKVLLATVRYFSTVRDSLQNELYSKSFSPLPGMHPRLMNSLGMTG